jgi:death-on-curing protein
MTEIEFLSVEDILDLHERLVTLFGGMPGVRDPGLLESAVLQAQATFDGSYVHGDVFEMAAAYAFHIAQNQPFVDGNKRTGLHSALVFLHINGVRITSGSEAMYNAMMQIAHHRLGKKGLAAILRKLAESPTEH